MSEVDISLPLFAYGFLQPRELSFSAIRKFVETSESGSVSGYTARLVNGLPTAFSQENSTLRGSLIHFAAPGPAYEKIAKIEQIGTLYRWEVVDTSAGLANLLIAPHEIRNSKRNVFEFEHLTWNSAQDPYLGSAIPFVCAKVHEMREQVKSYPQSNISGDWDFIFIDLQSTYLVTWTLFERIVNLTEGSQEIGNFVSRRELVEPWKTVFDNLQVGNEKLTITNKEDPYGDSITLRGGYFRLLYQVRNNIVHRGKSSAVEDFDQLMKATAILNNILSAYLQMHCESIKTAWDSRPGKEIFNSTKTGYLFQLRAD